MASCRASESSAANVPSWQSWHYLRTMLALALPATVMWSCAKIARH
jgi:hypothetical protein